MRIWMFAFSILAMSVFSSSMAAADGTLTGGGDGDWVTGGTNGDDDWSGAEYPGFAAAEFATFNGGATNIAVSAGNAPANALTVEVNGGPAIIDIANATTLVLTNLDFQSTDNISFTNTGAGGATVTLAGLATPAFAGSLTIGANVTLQISGAADFTGLTVTNNGVIEFSNTFTVTGASTIGGIVSVTSGNVTFDSGPAASTLNVSGGATATFTGATVDFSSTTVNNSGTITFDATSAGITVSSSSALNGDVAATGGNAVDFAAGLSCATLAVSGAGTHTVTGLLILSGALTKNGSGSLTVSSTASLSGNVTVSAGTVSLSNTEIGTTAAAGVAVTTSGTGLTVNGTLTVVTANSGNNQLNLGGTVTVTGNITVAAGNGSTNGSTLSLSASGTLNCEGSFTVAATTTASDGATFQMNAGSALVLGPNAGASGAATFSLGRNSAFDVNGTGTRADISVQSTNAYVMTADGNATIDGLDIGGYDASGLQLTANFGEAGSGSNSVTNVTFQNGQTGGTHLTVGPNLVSVLGSVSNATWTEILFDNTPGTGGNIAMAGTIDTSSLKISNGTDEYGTGHSITAAQAETGGGASLGADNDGSTEATNITWGATNNPPVLQAPSGLADISVGGTDPNLTGSALIGDNLAITFQATDADAGNTLTLDVTDAGTGSLSAAAAGFSTSFPAQNTGSSSVSVILAGTATTAGNVVLNINVSDGVGGTDSYSINITITATPTITVIGPNGTESFLVGGNMTITWTSSGVAGTVDILLSTNSGGAYSVTLASATANDGNETITVPNNPATTCRVRVRDTANPTTTLDDSDADFTIAVPAPAAGTLSASGNPGTQNAVPGSTRAALGFRVTETGGGSTLTITGVTVRVTMFNNAGGVAEAAVSSITLRRGGTTLGSLTNSGWTANATTITCNFTALSEDITAGSSADFNVLMSFAGTTAPTPSAQYFAEVLTTDISSASTISGTTVTGGTITLINSLPDDPLDEDPNSDSCDLASHGGSAWPLVLAGLFVLALALRRRREMN